jgi:hypothetical protein
MAQAADSPIGFRSAAKDPDPLRPGDDALAELQAWQASPAGMVEADIFRLASTISDLERLGATPLGLRLLVAELPDLELIQTEITRLVSELRAIREIAA